MQTPVLEIEHLSKSYGYIKALDDFTLTIHKGEVFGILGPNGSGKTTTLGILLDILKADKGHYRWFGKLPDSHSRRRIGALLEQPLFYPYLSAERNLELVADIKGAEYDEIDSILKKVGLFERKTSKFKTFSLGMKQRLAIAAALIGDPEVLILDEPTNGLDPKSIAEIRNLIIDIANKGLTVILASHLLDEVQKTCSHVAILDKGKSLHSGKVEDVLNSSSQLELKSENMSLLKTVAVNFDFVGESKIENETLVLSLKRDIDPAQVNKELASQGIYLSHISLRKRSLESYFLELLSGNDA
ncbi:MAG: ATP-binding cassette domain-containing protein [Bacteroidetes bacterium]|nr:ATP-binding cassette domain-containing protein [Bacteroidota bacterium]